MKVYGSEIRRAKSIRSSYRDFVADEGIDKGQAWRDAYFHLLEWKNTWCIPYKMDIHANRDNVPYVSILIPDINPSTPDMLKEMMESYGYRDVKITDTKVCTFSPDWQEDISEYIAEF